MLSTSIILALLASIVVAISAICLKKTADKLTWINWITNKLFLLGLCLFGLGNLLFIFALRQGELSVIYPITSIQYVFVALFAAYHLKERVTLKLSIGIAFVIIGSILVLF